MVLLFKSIIALSLTTLVLSDNLSWEEENFVHAISGIKSVRSNTKRESEVVDYDEIIHGPTKAFRLAGPAARSFRHSDGSFHLENYHSEMEELLTKEMISQDHLKKSEVLYRKRNLDAKFSRQQKRTSSGYGIYEFDTDIHYSTELVSTIQVGVPPQPIPFIFDLSTSETIVFSDPLVGTGNGKLASRSNPAVVYYDIKKSGSAHMYARSLARTIWVQTSNDSSVFQPLTTFGNVVVDSFTFASALPAITASFLLFNAISPKKIVPRARLGIAPFALAAATPPDYSSSDETIVAPTPGAALIQEARRGGLDLTRSIQVAPVVADPNTHYTGYASSVTDSSDEGDLQGMKRRSLPSLPPYSAEILIGGTDPNLFIAPIIKFPVVGTPGISQKLIWQLSFGGITVIQPGQTTITTPSINTVRFDVAHQFIYLDPTFVKQLYAGLPSSKVPTARNPFYTHYCRNPPTISFNAVDIGGVNRLLTLNARDWDVGQSFDSPGWCVGAIQAMPTGATHQVMGLQFFKTFYTVLTADSTTGEGSTIGLAIAKRS